MILLFGRMQASAERVCIGGLKLSVLLYQQRRLRQFRSDGYVLIRTATLLAILNGLLSELLLIFPAVLTVLLLSLRLRT